MSAKIGFWSVFELVTISQIGSGLMLPANLAPYGSLSLIGWIISSLGTILLAIMFSQLCNWFPRTGGPHVYVKEAFGLSAAFFTGWTYWVISWVSTFAIIVSTVGYLTPIIGIQSPAMYLALEIFILIAITAINFKGVSTAGKTKFFLLPLKMIPLLILPIIALFFFDKNNFIQVIASTSAEYSNTLNNVVLLTLWGFIGFESATASADEINEPRKTIPRALILGTIFVTFLYFVSSLGILGVMPGNILMNSQAPYADTAKFLFGGNWHLIISFIAALICLGAINAWTLASGQIAIGITQDGLMPKFFARKNKYGAPIFALLLSCIGTIPLILMTHSETLVQKVNTIIDFSVTSFLFVYVISCISFLKLLWHKKTGPLWQWLCGIFSLGFCVWVISATPFKIILVASFFTLSGLPIYIFRLNKYKRSEIEVAATAA